MRVHRFALYPGPLAPPAAVVVVALVLQAGVTIAGSRTASSVPPALRPLGILLEYGAFPSIVVPALEASFVARVLAGREAVPLSASQPSPPTRPADRPGPTARIRATPGPSPQTKPTPSPAPSPTLVGDLSKVRVTMHADKLTAEPGEEITYTVLAHNESGGTVVITAVTTTHIPLGTLSCSLPIEVPACIGPGDYDGSEHNSLTLHLNPLPQERIIPVRAGATGVLMTLRVQVLPAALPGLVLHNHAHVEILADGRGEITATSPDVTVDLMQSLVHR